MRLTLHDVGHRFDQGPLLFGGVSGTFVPGDMVAVTGPSGSGKSTLLAIVAGWIKPLHGNVERAGLSSVTWVPQLPFGVAQRTVLDQAVLPLLYNGASRSDAEERAREVLQSFGLLETVARPYSQLSGGEAQRLALTQAVLGGSSLVLVDEPTAQLDPANATDVIDVLENLAGGRHIVIIATHDPRVVSACPLELALGAAA